VKYAQRFEDFWHLEIVFVSSSGGSTTICGKEVFCGFGLGDHFFGFTVFFEKGGIT